METLQSTSLNLRNGADEIIKKYCEKHKENFAEVRKQIIIEAERNTINLIPIDFYRNFYNKTIELLKD